MHVQLLSICRLYADVFAKKPLVGRVDRCLVASRGDDGGSCSEGLETAWSVLYAAASSRRHPAWIHCSRFRAREIHEWLRGPGRPRRRWAGGPRLRRHRPPVAGCCSLALLICLCEFLSAQIQVSRGARHWAGRPRLQRHRPPVAGCCPLALPMCLYEFLSAQIQPSHRAPH